ncbi:hypothetical protein [Bdellovibrio bacteriovorus]|uniref:hypothetical protein n=1 Tax=Bdellovibrio bacteriovorus TaxID=959 RepID=UPI0005A1C819|nr:hypothetical protein [Bdellovibrio bacteriovorus]
MITKLEDRKKLLINKVEVSLPAAVRGYLEFQGLAVVVLEREYSLRNIYAYTASGELKWIIEPVPFQVAPPGYSMVANENGQLLAVAKGTYVVDFNTGEILKEIKEYK